MVGSRKKLELKVSVKNHGEDSYETVFNLTMPYDVQFIKVNKTDQHVSYQFLNPPTFNSIQFPFQQPEVICHGAKPELTGTNELVCDIGNPLKGGKKVRTV